MVLMADNEIQEARKYEIFDEEFAPQADALYNFAYHLTLSDADAADLVQEAFLKAFRFINSYEVGTNPKAWLFKILKNAFINKYRKEKKRPNQIDFDDVIRRQDDEHSPYSTYQDLRVEMFDQMMGDEITIAINRLPVDFRTVILLCDVEGFSYEEISKIIDIPIGTVRSRLFRARNMLKKQLNAYAKSLGYEDKRAK